MDGDDEKMNKKEDIDWEKKEIGDSKSLFMLEAIKANKQLQDLKREGYILNYDCNVSSRQLGIVTIWAFLNIGLGLIFVLFSLEKAMLVLIGITLGWLICQEIMYMNKIYCRNKLFKQWSKEK